MTHKKQQKLPTTRVEIKRIITDFLANSPLNCNSGVNNQLNIVGPSSKATTTTKLLWGLVTFTNKPTPRLVATISINDKCFITVYDQNHRHLFEDLAEKIHGQLKIGVSTSMAA